MIKKLLPQPGPKTATFCLVIFTPLLNEQDYIFHYIIRAVCLSLFIRKGEFCHIFMEAIL